MDNVTAGATLLGIEDGRRSQKIIALFCCPSGYPVSVSGLNWNWIALGLTVPLVAAILAAIPLWRKEQWIFGNIAGTVLIFASALALIFREYVEIDFAVTACLDEGIVCFPEPSAFTRFAIYASIGLLEIFALFYLSLKVEQRRRRRGYAPEWRR